MNNVGRGEVAYNYLRHRIFLQNLPLPVGDMAPFYTSFLERTRPTNGISIEYAVFLNFTVVTNGQTDGRTDRRNTELMDL